MPVRASAAYLDWPWTRDKRFYGPGPQSSLMADLVSYWSMSEGGGDRLDSYGKCSWVPSQGVAGRTAGPFTGSYALSLRIANTASFVCTDNPYFLQLGNRTHTWALWVRLISKPTTSQIFLRRSDSVDADFQIDYSGSAVNRFRFAIWGTPSGPVTATEVVLGSPQVNTWYLLWCEYNYSTKTFGIHVQGNSPTTATLSGFTPDAPQGVATYLGRTQGPDPAFPDADVGPMALWHRLLTNQQKSDYYNTGLGQVPPFFGVA